MTSMKERGDDFERKFALDEEQKFPHADGRYPDFRTRLDKSCRNGRGKPFRRAMAPDPDKGVEKQPT